VYLDALNGLAWECESVYIWKEAIFRPYLGCKHSEILENVYLTFNARYLYMVYASYRSFHDKGHFTRTMKHFFACVRSPNAETSLKILRRAFDENTSCFDKMGQEIRALYIKTEVLFRRTSIPFELVFLKMPISPWTYIPKTSPDSR